MTLTPEIQVKLRCAIAVSSFENTAWYIPVIKSLFEAKHIEITCCLLVDTELNESVKYFSKVELKTIKRKDSDFFLKPYFVSQIEYVTQTEQFLSLGIDFVVNFSGVLPNQELDQATRFGFWQYCFGDQLDIKMAGVREYVKKLDVQAVTLFRKSPKVGALQTLKAGRLKLFGESLPKHQRTILQICHEWPNQIAKQILQLGDLKTTIQEVFDFRRSSQFDYFRAFFLAELGFLDAFYSRLKSQFFFQQWNVGIISSPIAQLLVDGRFKDNVKWWPAPPSPMSFADPFPVLSGGRVHIFAEKFSCIDNFGSISCFSFNENGEIESEGIAINTTHHRSYPCTINVEDEIFLICESLETNELVILKCQSFPGQWIRHSVVATDRIYSDPTLFQHGGRWWVFATSYDLSSAGNSMLYAWYSENNLTGPWQEHALNPIKCDVSSSRCAGSPFYSDDSFYRPAQDCLTQYGKMIVINEILELDPTHFRECKIKTIEAEKNFPDGIHHISGFKDLTFIDGRRDSFAPWLGLQKIFNRLMKKIKVGKVVNLTSGPMNSEVELR